MIATEVYHIPLPCLQHKAERWSTCQFRNYASLDRTPKRESFLMYSMEFA